MRYNQIIFNSLAARKAIFIEGIGVVSVVRKGSLKSNPGANNEFPHYELVLSNSECPLSLKEAFEGDYGAWLQSVTKVTRNERIINIGGSFTLRLKGDGTSEFDISTELEMLLNPFSNGKKKRSRSLLMILSSILVTVACCGCIIFFIIDSGYINLPKISAYLLPEKILKPTVSTATEPIATPCNKEAEEDIFTSECKKCPSALDSALISRPLVKVESLAESTEVDADTVIKSKPAIKSKPVKRNIAPIAEPQASESYTKPISGRFYLVISSFRTQAMARKDIPRLERILENKVKVRTTKKIDGNYINYIYIGKTEDEVVTYQMTLNGKYDQLAGMWVYEMK